MKLLLSLVVALGLLPGLCRAEPLPAMGPERRAVSMSTNACWWAGIIEQGCQMPLAVGYQADLHGDTYGNQGQPLLLSNQGDVIWCEEAVAIHYSHQALSVESRGSPVSEAKGGHCLRDAFLCASRTHFPPSGKTPSELLFSAPQYNTWIELMYNQNQQDILQYAQGIVDHNFPPGVLMIDDNWQRNYGQWSFRPDRFSDPKAMVARLHTRGFKVMLWVCPFVNTNCPAYPELARKKALLTDPAGAVAAIKWWNGTSALLDFSNPAAVAWFRAQLDFLQQKYQIDGFKFDGGDSSFYQGTVAFRPVSPNTQSELYGRIGLDYPMNEYRAMWKMGGQPLAERLRDKEHSWSDLQKLVPNILLEGLMGYPFSCPDMIGGGEYKSFQNGATIDQDLVVRSAQCHALMPMMQFSVAPWRILDERHLRAVLKAVQLRQQHKDFILRLVRQSAQTGEPVVRSLEYVFPHQGYERVNDQFLLGDQLLVAPVLEKGACLRTVLLPPGAWKAFNGKRYRGAGKITVPVPFDQLCYFERID